MSLNVALAFVLFFISAVTLADSITLTPGGSVSIGSTEVSCVASGAGGAGSTASYCECLLTSDSSCGAGAYRVHKVIVLPNGEKQTQVMDKGGYSICRHGTYYGPIYCQNSIPNTPGC